MFTQQSFNRWKIFVAQWRSLSSQHNTTVIESDEVNIIMFWSCLVKREVQLYAIHLWYEMIIFHQTDILQ